MTSLILLLLGTPVFGLSLHFPDGAAPIMLTDYSTPADLSPAAITGAETEIAAKRASDTRVASAHAAAEQLAYTQQTKRRNALAKPHRLLGMATWAAMTATVALGTIQYYNLYGFFDDGGSNPCVTGRAIFGQGQCTGTPWPHLVAAGVTTALYATTFTISLVMPDPDDLANSKGAFASTLRLHKSLRWIHFGGMVAQLLLGVVIANDLTGLDRTNDYGTLQALATAHLAAGLITYGALTWAGALMTF